jgi:hypothetical protein
MAVVLEGADVGGAVNLAAPAPNHLAHPLACGVVQVPGPAAGLHHSGYRGSARASSAAAERGRSPLQVSSMVAAAKPSTAQCLARATSRGYIVCSPPGWPSRISGAGADAGVHRMPGISPRVKVVPSGSARERRSRTTYRPTVTPEGSTHVDTASTGTTSSISRTAAGKLAVITAARQQVSEGPHPTPHSSVRYLFVSATPRPPVSR